MEKVRKKRKYFMASFVCVLVLILAGIKVQAALYNYEATSVELIKNAVGRYKLNYTGNTNFYDAWTTSGTRQVNVTYNDVGGAYQNSSTATLSAQDLNSTIAKAYLIWQARGSDFEGTNCAAAATSVGFITPNGGRYYISPTYAISDARNLGEANRNYGHYYTLAADVTGIVQNAGFGSYSVANIVRWEPSFTYPDSAGEYPGGDSVGAWQLVIVEENSDFPIRAVMLSIASEFHMGTDFNGQVVLGNGLKSKSVGTANGQFLFSALRSMQGQGMTEQVTMKNSNGTMQKTVYGSSTTQPGLYKNGVCFNGRDRGRGGICVDLSDVADIGNQAITASMYVRNQEWTTFNMLGMSLDIAYPEFTATQETKVNSSKSVTVNGSFTNTASVANTGIYNGNLVITLDDALTVQSASASVNGGASIVPTSISGNRVIFSGTAVASMMNGSTISYTVQCAVNNAGKTAFYNDAGFQGYLRSDGVSTGYWIDRMWTASSSGVPKYTLTVESGTGIESVSGAGEYPYGGTVNIRADVKPGYHWMGWNSGTFATSQSHSFTMPNKDIIIRADAEANTYTIVFNVNGGAEVTHLENITVHYGEKMILPDGGVAYKKYTLDGVNVTPDVLSGLLSLGSMSETEESETEELETQPEEGKRDKTVYESVYRGWSLEEEKDYFEPQLTPGAADIAHLADLAGVTDQNGAVITLYAVWDDCPWITAHTLYYTLEQAQSGFITAEEILSHAAASDREDGSPIAAGFHENGTSFSIPDYTPEDFTTFTDTGACTENLTVVDSSGSVYVKQIWVWVVNTEPQDVPPEGTTRFINEYYYYQPYELGGLADDSLWKTDPEYVKAITEAFENLKNDTPIESYHFTHEDILEMREYIDEHGFGNSKEPDALRNFYDRFMAPNRTK